MSLPATAPRALRRAFAADEARHDARRQSRAARQLAQRNAAVRAGHRRLRMGLWPYFRRRACFAIDRHKLAYLNAFEKFNCLFCRYANGLIACVGEVAARTEQYWCPIRHARRTRQPHQHYDAFVDYGDSAAYRRQLPRLRAALKE
ncbi:MAG: hypothetical protein Q7R30_06520 [Acidobacteriota bacterium]|nr:hypothetical protein [Acidobacteriota bacterium]